jgi:hypothetical protein
MNEKEKNASVSAVAQPAEAASVAAQASSTGDAPVQPAQASPEGAASHGPGKIVLG